ncbi:type II CAAX endopeptidase family protein [Hoylesella loescheii]|uniref:CPBP family intramembrane glutamic endopeptidase n=1 Tax=Hoylesella loescheii TaxID=840 RepID=UPI0028E22CE0|nr:type II CAAX endopeptidase family protein [Hoylesella loescheii]
MPIVSKDNNIEWGIYLFAGFVAFMLLFGIFMQFLLYDFSVYIKLPLSLLAAGITLYAFKKYLGLYVEDKARLSIFRQMRTIGIGWLVSTVYFSTVMACLYLSGNYVVTSVQFNFNGQLCWLGIFLVIGISEEIACRGIIFRLISDKWNVTTGLVVSSLLFGFLHIFNEGATVWSSLALALNSGWLMGMAYAYHQTIWVPIGMHWAWNYIQGNIFGCSVSGQATGLTPLITPSISGPDILTGGEFGPEASIITIVIGIAISIVYTMLYIKKKKRIGAKPEILF